MTPKILFTSMFLMALAGCAMATVVLPGQPAVLNYWQNQRVITQLTQEGNPYGLYPLR